MTSHTWSAQPAARAFSIAASPAPTTMIDSSVEFLGYRADTGRSCSSRHADLARIASRPMARTTFSGGQYLSRARLDGKIAELAGIFRIPGIVADVNLEPSQILPPAVQHLLAFPRVEAQVAAQIQESGFRHHMLAALVALDLSWAGAADASRST